MDVRAEEGPGNYFCVLGLVYAFALYVVYSISALPLHVLIFVVVGRIEE